MHFTWTEKPLEPPFVCVHTQSDGKDVGPFLQTDLHYLRPILDHDAKEVHVDRQVQRLYLSAQAIREMCEAPGSPLKALKVQAYEHISQNEARLSIELEAAEDRIRELESENELLRDAHTAIDVQALSGALVVEMKQHFAQKPGPKKAA